MIFPEIIFPKTYLIHMGYIYIYNNTGLTRPLLHIASGATGRACGNDLNTPY